MTAHRGIDRTIRSSATYRSESLAPRQPDRLYRFIDRPRSVHVVAPDTVAIEGMHALAITSLDYRIRYGYRPGRISAGIGAAAHDRPEVRGSPSVCIVPRTARAGERRTKDNRMRTLIRPRSRSGLRRGRRVDRSAGSAPGRRWVVLAIVLLAALIMLPNQHARAGTDPWSAGAAPRDDAGSLDDGPTDRTRMNADRYGPLALPGSSISFDGAITPVFRASRLTTSRRSRSRTRRRSVTEGEPMNITLTRTGDARDPVRCPRRHCSSDRDRADAGQTLVEFRAVPRRRPDSAVASSHRKRHRG